MLERPGRTAPVLLLLCAACIMPLLLPPVAKADTAYVIYGIYKEGSPSICPDPGQGVCKRVRWMSEDGLHMHVGDESGIEYDVWLNEPWPFPQQGVQGADLDYQSVTPLQ